MPLRDHFRPPVRTQSSWEGLHGGWPMRMVQQLSRELPPQFTAEPRVHLGTYFEIDVCAYEQEEQDPVTGLVPSDSGGAPPEPTLAVDTDLSEQYEYEVLVYDQSRG